MNNKKSIVELLENEIKETEKKIDRYEEKWSHNNINMLRHLNGVLVGLQKATKIAKEKQLYEEYLVSDWDPRD